MIMTIPSRGKGALGCIFDSNKCCARAGLSTQACHILIRIYLPRRDDGPVQRNFRLPSLHINGQVPLSLPFLRGPFLLYRQDTCASHNILKTQQMLHTFQRTAPIRFDPARIYVPVVLSNDCIQFLWCLSCLIILVDPGRHFFHVLLQLGFIQLHSRG